MIKVTVPFLFILASTPALAAPVPQDVQKLADRLQDSQKKLEQDELKRRKVLSALYEINKKIRRTVSEKSKWSQKRWRVEEQIRDLEEKLSQLESTSSSLKTQLAERLRALSRLGGQSLARMLLSAKSSSELDRHLKIMGLVASRDRDLIQNFRSIQKEIENRKEKLSLNLASLKTTEQELARRETQFTREQALKTKILEGLKKSQLFTLQNLKEIKSRLVDLGEKHEGLLDLLFRPSFLDQKGRLQSPVKAPIAARFGFEKTADQHWVLPRKGLVFVADEGSPVQAVFEGKVAHVGEIPGAGLTLILDHGDHFYSVYSGLSKSAMSPGDEVQTGQRIAQTGEIPFENRTGLHFEIRHFSEPQDPLIWMKGYVHEYAQK